jgi:GTPase SAR1 family protein
MLRKFLQRAYTTSNPPVEQKNKVFKICITGGPCSGKTTITSWLRQRFNPQYMVMTVPELATMTVGSGINIIPDFFEDDEHKYFTVSSPTKTSFD